jgi:hypothetical protein
VVTAAAGFVAQFISEILNAVATTSSAQQICLASLTLTIAMLGAGMQFVMDRRRV